MKRTGIVCLLLAIAMLSVVTGGALAEGEVTLSVSTADVAVGDEVVVAVDLGNAASVDSIQFNLNYDPAALEYITDQPGQLFPAEYCITNPDTAGCIRVAAASPYGLSSDGSMLTITFKALSAAGSAITLSDVEVSRIDGDFTQFKSANLDFFLLTTDGGVTISGAAMPAPVATPWLAPTPMPTPEPTPEPTEAPTPEPTEAAEETPIPKIPITITNKSSMLRYILIAVVALLVIAVIVIIVSTVQQKKKRRRRKKKKRAASQYYDREYRDREYERERDRSRERERDYR